MAARVKTYTPPALQQSSVNPTIFWLEGSDNYPASRITTGSDVSQWSDLSGQNAHATQATGSNQPTEVSEGLEFNGTTDYFDFDGSDFVGTDLTVFSVVSRTAALTDQSIIFGGNQRTVGQMLVYRYASDTQFDLDTFGNGISGTIPAFSSDEVAIIVGVVSATSGKRIYYNGTEVANNATLTQILNAYPNAFLGRFNTGSGFRYFNGIMRAQVVVQGDLSDAARAAISTDLQNRYGVN